MLCSFSIYLNIIYLTKHLSSNISRIYDIAKYYNFSYFLEYDGKDKKIDYRPLFQTYSCIVKPKKEVSLRLGHRTI